MCEVEITGRKVIGYCNGEPIHQMLHPVWPRECKDGDVLWVIELNYYPDWWTPEKHESGDYDPIADVVEETKYAATRTKAIALARKLWQTDKDKMQWGPRCRRAWYADDKGSFFFDPDGQWEDI